MAPTERVHALVELTGDGDLERRSRLLAAAYRASRSGVVYLLLRGLDRATVDRLLDPIVRQVGVDVCGVRYLEPDDPVALGDALRGAQIVVAASPAFRGVLALTGSRSVTVDEALASWRDLETRPGQRPLALAAPL